MNECCDETLKVFPFPKTSAGVAATLFPSLPPLTTCLFPPLPSPALLPSIHGVYTGITQTSVLPPWKLQTSGRKGQLAKVIVS